MKNKKKRKNNKIGTIITLVVVALAGAGYWYYASQPKPKDLSTSRSIGQSTKGETGQSDDSPSGETKQDGPTTPKKLLEPSGNFVSSHEVEMNSLVASSCETTSGAKCAINFTKDGVTKSLSTQGTDSEGTTFWEWTPKQIGLTPGEWVIEAEASLGTEVKTAKDAEVLRIL